MTFAVYYQFTDLEKMLRTEIWFLCGEIDMQKNSGFLEVKKDRPTIGISKFCRIVKFILRPSPHSRSLLKKKSNLEEK